MHIGSVLTNKSSGFSELKNDYITVGTRWFLLAVDIPSDGARALTHQQQSHQSRRRPRDLARLARSRPLFRARRVLRKRECAHQAVPHRDLTAFGLALKCLGQVPCSSDNLAPQTQLNAMRSWLFELYNLFTSRVFDRICT